MTDYLSESLLALVNCFILTSYQTFSNNLTYLEKWHSIPHKSPVKYNSHVNFIRLLFNLTSIIAPQFGEELLIPTSTEFTDYKKGYEDHFKL